MGGSSQPMSQAAEAPQLDYDPLNPVVKHEPYPYYAKLRHDEPVKWMPGLQAFAVARYDDVEAVLQDGRLFTPEPVLAGPARGIRPVAGRAADDLDGPAPARRASQARQQ